MSGSTPMDYECSTSGRISNLKPQKGPPIKSVEWMEKYQLNSDFMPKKHSEKDNSNSNWNSVLLRMKNVYHADNVFCAKDVHMVVNYTPTKRKSKHSKKLEIEVNMLMCTNSTGSMKMPLTVVSSDPSGFINIWEYAAVFVRNKSGQLTSEVVKEWLLKFDIGLQSKQRKILLVVHPIPPFLYASYYAELTNIEIIFFPSNNSSKLQPMDNIVTRMKQLLQGTNSSVDMEMIVHYWNAMIRASFIKNCFDEAGFFFNKHKFSPLQLSQITMNREPSSTNNNRSEDNSSESNATNHESSFPSDQLMQFPIEMIKAEYSNEPTTYAPVSAVEDSAPVGSSQMSILNEILLKPPEYIEDNEHLLGEGINIKIESPEVNTEVLIEAAVEKNEEETDIKTEDSSISEVEVSRTSGEKVNKDKVLEAFQTITEAFKDRRITWDVREALEYCKTCYKEIRDADNECELLEEF